jgi:hypothetical protein
MSNLITDSLSPSQRCQEVAVILGRGLLRLRACTNPPESCDSAPDSTDQKALDVPAPGDPHVSWLAEPRT